MSSKRPSKNRGKPENGGETAASADPGRPASELGGSAPEGTKRSSLAPEPEPFPWGLIWAGLVFVVLIALRKYLRFMFPILLLVSVFVPLLWYLWRQYKYRDLWDVYRDYDELMSLLSSKSLYTYAKSVRQSMNHLMAARDKAEGLLAVLQRADLPGQRARLEALEKQLGEAADPSQREALSRTIREASVTMDGYRRVEAFLGRYAEGKKHLAEQFRSLRLKLEVPVVDAVSPDGGHADEIDDMVHQLRTLDCTYETVDGQGEPQMPPRESERN